MKGKLNRLYLIRKSITVNATDIKIVFNAFFSNKASDLDNILKPSLDALQKVFEWNDRYCYEIEAHKHLVKRGEEKLEINIEQLCRQ